MKKDDYKFPFNKSWFDIINIDKHHTHSKLFFLSTNVPYFLLAIYFSNKDPILAFLFLLVFIFSFLYHFYQTYFTTDDIICRKLLLCDMCFATIVYLYMCYKKILNLVGIILSILILPFLFNLTDKYISHHCLWHIGTAFVGYYCKDILKKKGNIWKN